MKKILVSIFAVVVTLIILGMILYQYAFAPTESSIPNVQLPAQQEIRVLASNLVVPWDVAQLPGGDLLVTERGGELLRILANGEIQRVEVPRVVPAGEGGLMGVVLHPDFALNSWIYLYRTVVIDSTRDNEVVRFVYNDEHTLTEETIIISNFRGATYHDGGALSFGPDGLLYIATGDAGKPELAQNIESLAGKILRVTDTGEVPADNPFGSAVYSIGHRNSQGLAWDTQGQLWSTEHGRSGMQSGFDELNKIFAGANYGWPESQGPTVLAGTVGPVVHSKADDTWAPASLAAVGDTFYFAGLRGQRLYAARIGTDRESVSLEAFFTQEYGRLRAARIFGDTLYITTSNRDNRGQANAGDDQLIAIPLSILKSEEREALE
jgi:glucose/arabinose dehydrogenase